MPHVSQIDILEILNGISDQQAFDSDFGGDSDAEDVLCVSSASNTPTSTTRGSKRKNAFNGGPSTSPLSSSSCNINSHDDSNLSTISSEVPKLSRLRSRKLKSAINSNALQSSSGSEVDDSDFDPSYEPIPHIDTNDNILAENSDNENNMLNISEPLNIENMDLLVDFIENSDDDSNYIEDNNENNILFSFSKDQPLTSLSYDSFDFNEFYGPNVLVDIKSPMQNFDIYFSDFYQYIVDQSNLYSNQCGKNLNLSIIEFKAFLGILIIMGFHRLPSLRLYWSANENFYNLRISNIMTQKRFLNILRYLHLNDNSKMPKRESSTFDKLYKIRPMIDHLNNVYCTSFSPDRNLSCDESMVGFKGRSGIKQYMPMKPVKRGFKIWAICCAITGYLLKFIIYEGKKDSKEKGSLGEKTVLEMTNNYQDKGYCVFFDRFFSSINLVSELLKRKIFACGTMF
ncbi:unnamed protein product [Macrosiphum euphorbiae]|uniref:PiggyBac transposable element-derived protein domain-containing protein n=1 Tax=Macrosiphum euphorbiae TaxID=13131 RepID=A0AAV0XHD1_9HEMI|nr:unnamed protein product [Macrosiphum euphorbiae]